MTKKRINSRSKGIRGEQLAIQLLQPIIDQVYRAYNVDIPVLQRNTIQADSGGFDVVGLDWLALEVKNTEDIHVVAFWNQATRQAKPHQEPIVLYKQKFRSFVAIMRASFPAGLRFIHGYATVDIDTFLVWFRARLTFELERALKREGLFKEDQ